MPYLCSSGCWRSRCFTCRQHWLALLLFVMSFYSIHPRHTWIRTSDRWLQAIMRLKFKKRSWFFFLFLIRLLINWRYSCLLSMALALNLINATNTSFTPTLWTLRAFWLRSYPFDSFFLELLPLHEFLEFVLFWNLAFFLFHLFLLLFLNFLFSLFSQLLKSLFIIRRNNYPIIP